MIDSHPLNTIDPILRRQEVQHLVKLGRSCIYKMMAEGRFPKPLKIGTRAVGWQTSAIAGWLASLDTASVG